MSKDITISLCMIVKDEEATLERCLNSVKDIIDEFIIIDTGSKDKTKDIASKFKSKIYDFKWIEDFAAARNFAFSKATKDYIIWLDGDDYVNDDNKEKLIDLKKRIDKSIDYVSMNYVLTRDINGNPTFSFRRNRLVKRNKNFKWIGRIHEYLAVSGKVLLEDISIDHGKVKPHNDRNLKIFRAMINDNEEFSPRDTFYYANELYYNSLYKEAIDQYEKFINSGLGWIEDVKTATANLFECYTKENELDKRATAILKTFEMDTPRADLCCKLAQHFLEKNLHKQAIFWYKIALGCIPDGGNHGMNSSEYYNWIPSIQLCVCYCGIEDYKSAYYYNELTALYVPNSEKVEHNRRFLKSKFSELNMELPNFQFNLVERNISHL